MAETGDPEAPAYYHPSIRLQEQQQVEMECVLLDEFRFPVFGKFIRVVGVKCSFWRDMGRVIGASAGEETNLIYVEWSKSGFVHGRPITASQLRKKGAQI